MSIKFELDQVISRILRRLIADHEITTDFKDMADWDSLAHMQIILQLEEVFGIQFSLDEIKEIQTYQSLLQKLQRKV